MSKSLRLVAFIAAPLLLASAHSLAAGKSMADVLAASKPSDWRPLDPQNTMYLDLPGGRVVIELAPGTYVALVHLKEGSVCVDVGDTVMTGEPIGACGNSGNSTQPHLHLQAMDSMDLSVAHGLPIVFRGFRQWVRGARDAQPMTHAVPTESAVVEPS